MTSKLDFQKAEEGDKDISQSIQIEILNTLKEILEVLKKA